MSTLSQAQTAQAQKKYTSKWYTLSGEEVFRRLRADKNGLRPDEIAKRRDKYGPNELPDSQHDSKWSLFFHQFKSSLVYVLLAAAIISLLLGDLIDSGIIFLAVIINVVIGFYQENKAQNALLSLKKVVVNYCEVLRAGRKQEIKAVDLVPGDIVHLAPGAKVPADMRLMKSKNLQINEAPLTGESAEVEKDQKILSGDLILADQINLAFMGTQVTQGYGEGIVVATGKSSYLGHIASMVAEGNAVITPLQRRLSIFARKISLIVIVVCTLLFLAGLIEGKKFTEIFTTSVAIAVSAVPEGLLVAVTMVLAVGMRRILKQKALVKHLLAAETLGSTTVICTDKTGTLTEGEMRVVELSSYDSTHDFVHPRKAETSRFSEEIVFMLTIGAVCNNAYIENPEAELEHRVLRGSPTEKALLMAADNVGITREEIDREQPRLDAIPFDTKWKYMVTLNKDTESRNKLYIKGAPEILLGMSQWIYTARAKDKKIELSAKTEAEILTRYEAMSKRGLRVMAVGYKNVSSKIKNFADAELTDFIFLGLVGIKDPVRSDIKNTLQKVKQSGLKTIMITGDHQFTAAAIAAELDMPHDSKNILTGDKLKDMSESELLSVVDDITIYARVSPEDKLKIVKAWQDKGEVVAMTGDGINDAPALQHANIGIAVGSGTDVAKDTADLILLDNNFKTIIAAIKEGRVIYDNIKKIILYFLCDSFAEILIIAVGLILDWPIPLLAAQIIWINLVDDTFPALALTQEPADDGIMEEPPKKINDSILSRQSQLLIALISGAQALGALLMFYFYWQHHGLELARTMAFTYISINTLFCVFSIRNLRRPLWRIKFTRNKFLLGGVTISFLMQLFAIYNPFMRGIFQTEIMGIFDWFIIVVSSLALIVLIEIVKAMYYTWFQESVTPY